eukprot:364709-Chlamydomonas_euryale.AAC.25
MATTPHSVCMAAAVRSVLHGHRASCLAWPPCLAPSAWPPLFAPSAWPPRLAPSMTTAPSCVCKSVGAVLRYTCFPASPADPPVCHTATLGFDFVWVPAGAHSCLDVLSKPCHGHVFAAPRQRLRTLRRRSPHSPAPMRLRRRKPDQPTHHTRLETCLGVCA